MNLTGQLLISMPSLEDERFFKTVIYMCAHSKEGAMGIIINKKIDYDLYPDLLEQLGIDKPLENKKLFLRYGGPVESGRGFVLHSDEITRQETLSIDKGIALTSTAEFFEDLSNTLLEKNTHKILVSTDDGSYGEKGFVTDLVEKLVSENQFDGVYVCGPEIMMYKTVQSAHSRKIFVQASLERMMKCGVGICGSCCVGEDLVCKDGTVFDGDHLSTNKEFGISHRNKAGILENY